MGLLTLVYQNPPSRTHSISPLISSKHSSRLVKNMTVTDEWISISKKKFEKAKREVGVLVSRLGLKIGKVI